MLSASALAQTGASGATGYPGIGRDATPKEVAAWDIDVRPDFKGLPKGSGTVDRGQVVWESKCASCHGVFGESNEVFAPLVGGTTAADLKSGRVARLTDPAFPGRTTMMKLSSVATLWDYIRRAMPWAEPKSLSVEEVYSVTAYLLHLGGVLPETFTLSDSNIAQVQQRLPNRHGMGTDHGLWPGKTLGQPGKADLALTACMKDCRPEPKLASVLPDHARNAHGNLLEQQRLVGAQVGADTSKPPGERAGASAGMRATSVATSAVVLVRNADPATVAAVALARKSNCLACHGMDNKVVGPGMTQIAKKYSGRSDAAAYLAQKIQAGSTGVWGAVPMPAQQLSAADTRSLAQWLAQGAGK